MGAPLSIPYRWTDQSGIARLLAIVEPALFVADPTLFSIWLVLSGIVLDAFTTVTIPLGTSVTTPPAFLLLFVPVFVAHALLSK